MVNMGIGGDGSQSAGSHDGLYRGSQPLRDERQRILIKDEELNGPYSAAGIGGMSCRTYSQDAFARIVYAVLTAGGGGGW